MDALGLSDDLLQYTLMCRFRFTVQKILSLTGDDGQRVIDLMAGAGGKLGQGIEFLNLQSFRLAGALFLDNAVQVIDILFQPFTDRGVTETVVLCRQAEEIGQERLIIG